MAAAGKQQEKGKEPLNVVHQNAIWRETIAKEQRVQKLYTEFKFNPYNEHCVLPDKPNTKRDPSEDKEDEEFLEVYRRGQSIPKDRFGFPLTEAHEIGWDSKPLIDHIKDDVRLHHPRYNSEITTYMEAYWKQKEQEGMQQ